MAIKIYTKQYAGLLPSVYATKQHFMRTFGGALQVKDGVTHNDTFLELKTSPTDVVIQAYSTDPNVAFGTGTADSNRFGPRKEIISEDTKVAYDAPLAIHEGVDNVTVNDNADEIIAERAALHAEAWTEHINDYLAGILSAAASETLDGELSAEGIAELFAEARKKFVNAKVSNAIGWIAYVTPDVFNFLVDHGLTTTDKNSSANIDEQTLYKFKGFILEELPDEYFQAGEQVIFAADGVGVAGLGLQVYRVVDSEDFNGVAIQGAAKTASYIPDKNKTAIIKASLTAPAVED